MLYLITATQEKIIYSALSGLPVFKGNTFQTPGTEADKL